MHPGFELRGERADDILFFRSGSFRPPAIRFPPPVLLLHILLLVGLGPIPLIPVPSGLPPFKRYCRVHSVRPDRLFCSPSTRPTRISPPPSDHDVRIQPKPPLASTDGGPPGPCLNVQAETNFVGQPSQASRRPTTPVILGPRSSCHRFVPRLTPSRSPLSTRISTTPLQSTGSDTSSPLWLVGSFSIDVLTSHLFFHSPSKTRLSSLLWKRRPLVLPHL